VKLMSDMRLLWSMLSVEGTRFDSNHNRVGCEVYGILSRFC